MNAISKINRVSHFILEVFLRLKKMVRIHSENGFGVRHSTSKEEWCGFVCMCVSVSVCVCIWLQLFDYCILLHFPFSRSSFSVFDIQTSCAHISLNNMNSLFTIISVIQDHVSCFSFDFVNGTAHIRHNIIHFGNYWCNLLFSFCCLPILTQSTDEKNIFSFLSFFFFILRCCACQIK